MAEWEPISKDETERLLKELGQQSQKQPSLTQFDAPGLGKVKIDPSVSQAEAATLQEKLAGKAFTESRQRSAIQEPAFQGLAGATIPTLAGLAGLIPGLQGIPAQMALGAAGTALNQLAGFEPRSNEQIAISGGVPALIGGFYRGGKALLKGGAELVAPGALKEAGTEAIAERIGAKAGSAERVVTGNSVAKTLFSAAMQAPPVATRDLAVAADLAYEAERGMSNPNQVLLKVTRNLRDKFENMASTSYEDVMNEAQRLRLMAKQYEEKQPQVSKALHELREELLTGMESSSKVIRSANSEYRRYIATQDMVDAVRSGNPGNRIRKLFETNPTMISAIGLKDKKDVNEVYALADAISDVASSAPAGIGRQLLSALTEPIGQMLTTPTGRYFMRQLIKPTGKLTPAGLGALAQFGRAYAAQGANQQ